MTSPTGFSALPLSPELVRVTRELGYQTLTPIQARSIPILLQGNDLIGQSKTGSGKTAAFSLPLLQNLNIRNRSVQALVLSPTRELCAQVAREIRKLGRNYPGLQVLVLSGGQPIFPQLCALEKGVHVVVGTPGRVLDHLNRRKLDLSEVATLVLDEADRMLEMGFQEDMEKILKAAPKDRQTVLFSATYPVTVEAMSRNFLRNPVRVTIEESSNATSEIAQTFYEVAPDTKVSTLLSLIQQQQPESAIVFCNFKATVTELTQELSNAGISASCIHGDLEQYDRDRVMAKFRNRSTRVLVATDVAARGLDVEGLDVVFNYELPAQADVYVHRIGRTGRAGRKGLAISLASQRERSKIQTIEKYTGAKLEKKTFESEQVRVLPQGSAMQTLYIGGGRKEKVRPGDILGALTGDAGRLSASDIGKIEIHDRFAYVAVSASIASVALKRLQDGRIKGRKFRVEAVR